MPTVIDSLVVSLGLDASGFKAGQKSMEESLHSLGESTDRIAGRIEASGKQAAAFFSAIKTEALSLLGVFLAGKGIEEFVRSTTGSLADLGRAAFDVGMKTQDLQAFEQVIERMGGTAESARASLQGIARTQFQANTYGPQPEFLAAGGMIGANVMRDSPWQIMEKFIDWAGTRINQPGGAQDIIQKGGLLGISDMSELNAIMQLVRTSSLEAEMRRSVEDNKLASDKQIEAATKFQTSVLAFEQAVDGLARSVIPWETMNNIVKGLENLILHPKETIDGVTQDAQSPAEFLSGPELAPWLQDLVHFLSNPSETMRNPGINFIPNTPGSGPDINPPVGPTQSHATMLQAQQFFKSKGLTDAQVAGILAGGPAAESNFDPNRTGDYQNGVATSYGLFQHHNDRMRQLFIFAKTNHPNAQQQLDFAWWELTQGKYQGVLKDIQATPRDASAVARTFSLGFEGPAGGAAEADRRAASAQKFDPNPDDRGVRRWITSARTWLHGPDPNPALEHNLGRPAGPRAPDPSVAPQRPADPSVAPQSLTNPRAPDPHMAWQYNSSPYGNAIRLPDPSLDPRRLLPAPAPASNTTNNDHSSDIDVGSINIYPPSGDPHSIAAGIHRALQQNLSADDITAQSTTGLR